VQLGVITNTGNETKTPLVYTKLESGEVEEVINDESESMLVKQNTMIKRTTIALNVNTYDEYVDCYGNSYVSGAPIRRFSGILQGLEISKRFYTLMENLPLYRYCWIFFYYYFEDLKMFSTILSSPCMASKKFLYVKLPV
jgi:hypothetical protein